VYAQEYQESQASLLVRLYETGHFREVLRACMRGRHFGQSRQGPPPPLDLYLH
jgi:hypothetical protein